MYVIKEKGIYEIKLADDIDPGRKNIKVPNTVQRILRFGSDNEWIGKTLLTGQNLFKSSYLPKELNCDNAMALILSIVKNLGRMQEYAGNFKECEETALVNLTTKVRSDGSFVMPAIDDLEQQCKNFIQQADHALRELFNLVKLFYGKRAGTKWFGGFAKMIKDTDDGKDNFSEFLKQVLPLLQFIRNARNCSEHPRDNQKLVVMDFSLNTENQLVPPTIAVVHHKTSHDEINAAEFMRSTTDQLVEVVELMVVFLCTRHVQSIAGFPFQVYLLPEDDRTSKHVQYCIGLYDGKNVIPVS